MTKKKEFGDIDTWAAVAAELHTAGLVVGIDDRKLPEKTAPLLVAVVAVALRHDGSPGAVTATRTPS